MGPAANSSLQTASHLADMRDKGMLARCSNSPSAAQCVIVKSFSSPEQNPEWLGAIIRTLLPPLCGASIQVYCSLPQNHVAR